MPTNTPKYVNKLTICHYSFVFRHCRPSIIHELGAYSELCHWIDAPSHSVGNAPRSSMVVQRQARRFPLNKQDDREGNCHFWMENVRIRMSISVRKFSVRKHLNDIDTSRKCLVLILFDHSFLVLILSHDMVFHHNGRSSPTLLASSPHPPPTPHTNSPPRIFGQFLW